MLYIRVSKSSKEKVLIEYKFLLVNKFSLKENQVGWTFEFCLFTRYAII